MKSYVRCFARFSMNLKWYLIWDALVRFYIIRVDILFWCALVRPYIDLIWYFTCTSYMRAYLMIVKWSFHFHDIILSIAYFSLTMKYWYGNEALKISDEIIWKRERQWGNDMTCKIRRELISSTMIYIRRNVHCAGVDTWTLWVPNGSQQADRCIRYRDWSILTFCSWVRGLS